MIDLNISNYLDGNGKIKVWPSKRKYKLEVLKFLYSRFHEGIYYNEKEVNRIIMDSSLISDYTLLRREMIDNGFLCRTRDCLKYWKGKK